MFPHDYFPAGAFAPDYFPPVSGGVTPVPPPITSFGYRPRNQPIPVGWPIDLDDEELMFWIL